MTLRPEPYRHLEAGSVYDALELFSAEAGRRGVGMGALAIAWALAHPLMDAVIIGPRHPGHIDVAVQGEALPVTEAERRALGDMFRVGAST